MLSEKILNECARLIDGVREKNKDEKDEQLVSATQKRQKLIDDYREREAAYKELIDWGSLGDSLYYMRERTGSSHLGFSLKAYGIILLLITVTLSYLIGNFDYGFLGGLIATLALFFYLKKENVEVVKRKVTVRPLLVEASSDSPEYPLECFFKKIVKSSQGEEIDLGSWYLKGVSFPDSRAALGIFFNEELIAYICKPGTEWKISVLNDVDMILSAGVIAYSVQDKIEEDKFLIIDHFDILDEIDGKANRRSASISIEKIKKAWENVVLPEEQALQLLKSVIFFAHGEEVAPKGILLKGPPGTGKTLIARALSDSTDANFVSLNVSDVKGEYIGSTASNVKNIWASAREKQPTIIFVDECEGVFAKRGSGDSDSFTNECVQTFLAEWDGMGKSHGVLVIGATNRIVQPLFCKFSRRWS